VFVFYLISAIGSRYLLLVVELVFTWRVVLVGLL
jgi:hypothetical protein